MMDNDFLLTLKNFLGLKAAESLHLRINKITTDSTQVEDGDIFVAQKGTRVDSHQFLFQAQAKGAKILIGEKKIHEIEHKQKISTPYFEVKSAKETISKLAADFYAHPSRVLKIIGVTGTSGKTTTTFLIENILKESGIDVGLIGTIYCRYQDNKIVSSLTTPDSIFLQKKLLEMKKAGVKFVVMEVSSHGIDQARVSDIDFDVVVFTNLSPEHLDYHKTMEDYYNSKLKLFTDISKKSQKNGKNTISVINLDDAYGRRLFQYLKQSNASCVTFSKKEKSDYLVQEVSEHVEGLSFKINEKTYQTTLIGNYNIENVLAAVAASSQFLKEYPYLKTGILSGVKKIQNVPGRLERVHSQVGLHVFVDYAHKPDALQKVLETLRTLLDEKAHLITVVGCGGDRDRSKRPVMAQIAVEQSDFVFFTSDNPRTEDPQVILNEMIKGVPVDQDHFKIELDRKKAIFAAIQMAEVGDIVLIAGKGHEDYQLLPHPQKKGEVQKIHFDDREIAAQAIEMFNK